jgi:hypothetical protein
VDNVSNFLKVFVVASGVALLAGTVLLVALILVRANDDDGQATSPASAAIVDLPLPAGARIQQVISDRRGLVLLLTDAAERQYIAVVDRETGERVTLLRVQPEP